MMRVFVRVAQRQSFAGAAQDLRMSRASVTKHVVALERRLGARLLDRTTRSVSVTEAGRIYLDRCVECLQTCDDSEAAVAELSTQPKGVLRLGAPFDMNRYLPDLLARFVSAHPAIDLDVRLSNRTFDMVDEGIDVYLRVTNVLGPDVIARRLATSWLAVWGARHYFQQHGRPRTPSDLMSHRFALFSEPPVLDTWAFERDGQLDEVRLRPSVVANSGDVLLAAASRGAALAVLPSFLLTAEHLAHLEPVLLEWSVGYRGLYAVYPHRRFVASKVRAFVDFARHELGDGSRDPWWPSMFPHPGSRELRPAPS